MKFYDFPLSELAAEKALQFQAANNLIKTTPAVVQNLPIDQTLKSFPWKTFIIISTALAVTLIILNGQNSTKKDD